MGLTEEILDLALRQSEEFWKDDLEECERITQRMHKALRRYASYEIEDEENPDA